MTQKEYYEALGRLSDQYMFDETMSNWTWFIAEYDPEKEIAWGYVMGLENEYGTIDIKELKEVRGPFGLPIERDISFDTIKEKELMDEIKRGVA